MRNSREKGSVVRSGEGQGRCARLLDRLGWSYREAVAVVVAVVAVGAIVANALFMQSGPHPAPMFKDAPSGLPATNPGKGTTAALGARGRPLESRRTESPQASLRPVAEIIADIQRELARRGFFEGVVDGRRGPRTEAAIREFEMAAGMALSAEPSEDLLAAIRRANVKPGTRPTPSGTSGATAPRPPQPVRSDPIAEALAPSKRIR